MKAPEALVRQVSANIEQCTSFLPNENYAGPSRRRRNLRRHSLRFLLARFLAYTKGLLAARVVLLVLRNGITRKDAYRFSVPLNKQQSSCCMEPSFGPLSIRGAHSH